jgi:hypothetical protein
METSQDRFKASFVVPLLEDTLAAAIPHGTRQTRIAKKTADCAGDAFRILRIAREAVAGFHVRRAPIREIRNQKCQTAGEVIEGFVGGTGSAPVVDVFGTQGRERQADITLPAPFQELEAGQCPDDLNPAIHSKLPRKLKYLSDISDAADCLVSNHAQLHMVGQLGQSSDQCWWNVAWSDCAMVVKPKAVVVGHT